MEFEFIKEAIPIEKEKGTYAPVVEEWLTTDNKTLVFRCANEVEAKRVAIATSTYRRKHNQDFTIFRKGTTVYLVRA